MDDRTHELIRDHMNRVDASMEEVVEKKIRQIVRDELKEWTTRLEQKVIHEFPSRLNQPSHLHGSDANASWTTVQALQEEGPCQTSSTQKSNSPPSGPAPHLDTELLVLVVQQGLVKQQSLKRQWNILEQEVGMLASLHPPAEQHVESLRRQAIRQLQSIASLSMESQSLILKLESLLRSQDQQGTSSNP
jgi:hypothetical protein